MREIEKYLKELCPSVTVDYETGIVRTGSLKIWLSENKGHRNGARLLRKLERSPHTITIKITNESIESGPHERHFSPDCYDRKTGSDSLIGFFSEKIAKTLVHVDGRYSLQNTPSSVALGHELIHSLHSVQGNSKSNKLIYGYTDLIGHNVPYSSGIQKEELRTVGIRYIGILDITENMLRKELGIEPRVRY